MLVQSELSGVPHEMKFDHIIRLKASETQKCIWKVRLYRVIPKRLEEPFRLRGEDGSDNNVLGMKNYTPEQLAQLKANPAVYPGRENSTARGRRPIETGYGACLQ